jgi:molybdopterin-guanine dinucleotide biosynthesis protein A
MKSYSKNISGILLAGGNSSRMGQDKAFMKYGNKFLYEYSLAVLNHFSSEIFIGSSNPLFNNLEYPCIPDEITNLGPIGGLYSCLKQIKNTHAIVLPCDLPLISEKLIDLLLTDSEGYDISIALNNSKVPEPLIGVYASSIVPEIEKMIDLKVYKIQDLLNSVRTNYISFPDVPPETFRNINDIKEFNSLPSR